jgi:hypothetical protein
MSCTPVVASATLSLAVTFDDATVGATAVQIAR